MGVISWLVICASVVIGVMLLLRSGLWLFQKLYCWLDKEKCIPRWLKAIQRWGTYKETGTLWSIALIIMVMLAVCLGSYALYTEGVQQSSSVPQNVISDATEPAVTNPEDVSFEVNQRNFFGMIMDVSLYGIQTVQGILDGDSSKLDKLPENLRWLGWLVSWLVPLLTVSTAVTLLIGFLPKPLERKKEYLIFPQLEENSLLLAEDMMHTKDAAADIRKDRMVIFLRVDEEKITQEYRDRMQNIRARRYPYTEGDLLRIHWSLRRKKLRIFFLSADTELNFTRMQTLLTEVERDTLFFNKERENSKKKLSDRKKARIIEEENRGTFQQELYLLSESESSPMLIDYLRKQMCENKNGRNKRKNVFAHTELRLLDRYRTVMYDLMKDKPLYEGAVETNDMHQINVLILGFGRVGKAFYRTAASFCPMQGYQTTFTIRDKNMKSEWELLKLEFPECENIGIPDKENLDVLSEKIENLVQEKKYTYILLSLGDDERNIKVASRLARYYMKQRWENDDSNIPAICVNLENNIRTEYVSRFFAEEKCGVQLHVFGTDNKTFSEKMMIDRRLWEAARKLQKGLKEEENLSIAYWSEYERRSSIAGAAHASWHVKSVTQKNEDYDNWYSSENAEAKIKKMVETEHKRWMNYSRCEGMRSIKEDVAKKILSKIGHHTDPVAQLTPCLVEAKDLDKVYKYLYPEKEYRTFKERDHFVVANAGRLAQILSEDGTSQEEEIKLKGYDEISN